MGHANTLPALPDILPYCHERPWNWIDQRMWRLNIQTGDPVPCEYIQRRQVCTVQLRERQDLGTDARSGDGGVDSGTPHGPFRADFILQHLLDKATPAEEAAIRRITPFVKIIRLRYGNIKSRGVTTCVMQDSVINNELPNLPEDTRVITIHKAPDVDPESP